MDAQTVRSELAAIERSEEIRVLYACESGSRAWGFASPDSDFDVRFIYVHTLDWYLSIQERRDVFEAELPGDLDVSGWELRKALRLLAKGNACLMEWLGSPIVYQEDSLFAARMRALIPNCFNPLAANHHYLSTAKNTLAANLDGHTIGIKKLFYVLRPLLACRWIRVCASMPPTAFDQLLPLMSSPEADMVNRWLRLKAGAAEAQPIDLIAEELAWLHQEIDAANAGRTSINPAEKPKVDLLDAVLREFVLSK